MKSSFKLLTLLIIACVAGWSQAFIFVPPAATSRTNAVVSRSITTTTTTTTSLQERRWNFNEGQSPWGMKVNAEIWNGRMAQMAFVLVFLQELVQGKGVIEGIQQGDPVNLVALALAGVSLLGLTVFLAIKGDDDYITRDLEGK